MLCVLKGTVFQARDSTLPSDPADVNAMKNMFDLYIVKPYLHYYVNMPIQYILQCFRMTNCDLFLYSPQTLFVVGILFSRCPSVRACVRPCVRLFVTFCLLNILKSHCLIFIKPCKHVHIYKTNNLDKK